MTDYQPVSTLACDPSHQFTIYEAFAQKLNRSVILKVCECTNILQADALLKSAIRKVLENRYNSDLISIYALQQTTSKEKFTVNFVWEKYEDILDREMLASPEPDLPSGNEGYTRKKLKYTNPYTAVKIKEAWSERLGRPVASKCFKFIQLTRISESLKEVLAQAKVTHPRNCELIDVCLLKSRNSRVKVQIIMERLEKDLQQDVNERKELEAPYTEVELFTIFAQVVTGLLYAKSKRIAHQDIKPSNVLFDIDGDCKLADFGSTWQRMFYSETGGAMGTLAYMSPEARVTMKNPDIKFKPFQSDVFSLGMFMLHLATLNILDWTGTERDLKSLIERAVAEVGYRNEFRDLMLEMTEINPDLRPDLEKIKVEVLNWLEIDILDCSEVNLEKISHVATRDSNTSDSFFQIMLPDEFHINSAEIVQSEDTPDFDNLRSSIMRKFPNESVPPLELVMIGIRLFEVEQYYQAIEKFSEAHFRLKINFRKHFLTPLTLYNWGNSLFCMKQYAEAAEKYKEAVSFLILYFPNELLTSESIYNWAISLFELKQYEAAASKCCIAHSFLSKNFPCSYFTMQNIHRWAVSLFHAKQIKKAESIFRKAHSLLLNSFPNSRLISINLHNWGLALFDMGKYKETAGKFSEAYSLLVKNTPIKSANVLDFHLSAPKIENIYKIHYEILKILHN